LLSFIKQDLRPSIYLLWGIFGVVLAIILLNIKTNYHREIIITTIENKKYFRIANDKEGNFILFEYEYGDSEEDFTYTPGEFIIKDITDAVCVLKTVTRTLKPKVNRIKK